MKANKKASLASIFATVFIDLLGFGILIPILPTFGTNVLKINEFQIGIAIAIYSIAQFIFNPLLGLLSDRFGRKKIIIFTLFLSSLSYVIFSFTTTYWQLLFSRAIGGIGGGNIGAAQAYIADITTKEERAKGMGLIGAAFGLGFIFGPLLGAILINYGYFAIGIAAASLAMISLLYSIFFLKESKPDFNSNQINFKIRYPIFDITKLEKEILILMFVYFIITFSIANIFGTFALLSSNVFNFSESENGLFYAMMGIAGVFSQTVLLRILKSFLTENKIVAFSSLTMAFGLAMFPFGANFFLMSSITIIYSIGSGILQPVLLAMISKKISEHKMGSILGINQSLSALARILGPLWGGFSFNYIGYRIPFFTGSFFMILLIVFIIKKLD